MSKIESILLKSNSGFIVQLLTLGGIITKIMAKDKYGMRENVVLCYDDFEDYHTNPLFLGCFIGPVAGRTKAGKMLIDDLTLTLDVSVHPNALHSGKQGLHNVKWSIKSQESDSVILTYDSKTRDGSMNYQLTYSVSEETLSIEYAVTSSNKTYLSLTNHSYFNLSGNPEQSILTHDLKLNCSHIAQLDQDSLPIACLPIEAVKVDFFTSNSVGSIIESTPEIFSSTLGIDHPFKCMASDYVAYLSDPQSGRAMYVATTEPYVIVYSGNFLQTGVSTSGKRFNQYSGICFETQDLPNVVNNKLDHVEFVSPTLPYSHKTTFTFLTSSI
jgi:aldose 1-epimerase